MLFLGIDVGSSFLKSSVLDLDAGKVYEAEQVPTPAFSETDHEGKPLVPEKRELSMEVLTEAVKGLIDKATEKYEIRGVVFSVQMHGFMLFSPDGRPLTNYITWQDTRSLIPDGNGNCVLEELRGEKYASYFAENGVLLRTNHSVTMMLHYLREHGIAPGSRFAMIGDGLTWMLTGERTWIHPTNAASSGLFSLTKMEWNRELLEAVGLDMVDFPEVKDTGEAAGIYHSPFGDIPLYASLGDQQATVFGIGAGKGDIFINIGTGGQIGCVTEEPVPGQYETRPFFDGQYIRTVTMLPSGRTINVLMRFLKSIGRDVFGALEGDKELERRVWQYIDSIDFDKVEGRPLDVDMSFFDAAGGHVAAIGGDNFTIDNLIRSSYLSIAQEYYKKSDVLHIDWDAENAGKVFCTGGVIRKNRPLFRCIDAALPWPCRIAECTDDSMEGLLQFARRCG